MLKDLIKKIYFSLFYSVNKLPNENDYQFSWRRDVLSYYLKKYDKRITIEEKAILQYLKNNIIHYFPYPFVNKYDPKKIEVYFDKAKDLRYVIYKNKKLYFKRNWDDNKIKSYYNFLLIEQDEDSPHRYFTNGFNLEPESIVIDAGTAEGNFALDIIEKVKKIYLFESDPEWIEPLNATFEPWKNKVGIINKFVSDNPSETSITIDEVTKDRIDFIKADVEGCELKLLKGTARIITRDKPRLILCTYHNSKDAVVLKEYLESKSYKTEYSKGLMIYLDDTRPPYFRKVLIRAQM